MVRASVPFPCVCRCGNGNGPAAVDGVEVVTRSVPSARVGAERRNAERGALNAVPPHGPGRGSVTHPSHQVVLIRHGYLMGLRPETRFPSQPIKGREPGNPAAVRRSVAILGGLYVHQ